MLIYLLGCKILERRIEPIPGLLQDVIDRFIALQVITVEARLLHN